MGSFESRVLGQGLLFVTHTVRLNVRLADDIEAVTVAEFVPKRVIRIVTGTYCIDIQLLHYLEVANHISLADHISLVRIHFVTVHALDEHRLAVDLELPVLYHHGPEAHALIDTVLSHTPGVPRTDLESIEHRFLCRPWGDAVQSGGNNGLIESLLILAGGNGRTALIYGVALAVREFHVYAAYAGTELHAEAEFAVRLRLDAQVLDAGFRTGIYIGIPRQAAHTPEVLVLEIGAVAPAENLQRNQVVAFDKISAYVKTGVQLAVLAVSHLFSIDPHAYVGGGAAYAEEDIPLLPGIVPLEVTAVLAHMIVLYRRYGRIALVVAVPGVIVVEIHRVAVAVELPHTRNRHSVPGAVVEVGAVEIAGAAVYVFVPLEIPYAVQAEYPVIRVEGGPHGKSVAFEHSRVLPVSVGCVSGCGTGAHPSHQNGRQNSQAGEDFDSHICYRLSVIQSRGN